MFKVLSHNQELFLRYGATCEKKDTPVLVTKCRNSKSFNLIYTKKYTNHLIIIRNNCIKFHEIWISCFQVTVRHVYAGQTDGHRTFVYHNTSHQNFDRRIKTICIYIYLTKFINIKF